jgi:hypothetical protein
MIDCLNGAMPGAAATQLSRASDTTITHAIIVSGLTCSAKATDSRQE